MPHNPEKENFIRKHMMLDRADLTFFEQHWGKTIGVSAAVRLAMRRFRVDFEAKLKRIT